MKTFTKQAAQGDLLVVRIPRLPEGAKLDKGKGAKIVGHSETGHHHVIDGVNVKVFRLENDPMVCFLQVSEPYADLVHQRPYDTHETLRIPVGVFKIQRQREHTPEGWRVVSD